MRPFSATALAAALVLSAGSIALAQLQVAGSIEPYFSIWDVQIGEPVTQIPPSEVGDLRCSDGTPLLSAADFSQCVQESSGLREMAFSYDDEGDYIGKARGGDYDMLLGGTSIYGHPVILSTLVDREGIVRGIRIVTDPGTSGRERRVSVTLGRNLKGLFGGWAQSCENLPPAEGERPVARRFVHEVCTAVSSDGTRSLRIEAVLMQRAADGRDYRSGTRFELLEMPYAPVETGP